MQLLAYMLLVDQYKFTLLSVAVLKRFNVFFRVSGTRFYILGKLFIAMNDCWLREVAETLLFHKGIYIFTILTAFSLLIIARNPTDDLR